MARLGEEAVGQLLDWRRHRRGKEQRLAAGRKLGADRLDVGHKAHVQHPVGLVDHQNVDDRQQYLAAPELVHEAARRGDQHVDAFFQRLVLVAKADAADQKRHRKLAVDRKSVVEGKSVAVRVDLGGRRILKKKQKKNIQYKDKKKRPTI